MKNLLHTEGIFATSRCSFIVSFNFFLNYYINTSDTITQGFSCGFKINSFSCIVQSALNKE